jgi:hypothetical protein
LHQNFQNKKPIPGNLSQKSATRNSDGTSPPLQNKKTKKLNNPKCQRKNEQSRRETEKFEDPKPTTHTHTQPAPPTPSRVPLSLVSMAKRRRRKNREKEKRDGRE